MDAEPPRDQPDRSRRDPGGRAVTYSYDVPTAPTVVDGGTAARPGPCDRPAPDADRDGIPRVVSITRADGSVTRFDHDADRRLIRVTGPDGHVEEFPDRPGYDLVPVRDPATGRIRHVQERRRAGGEPPSSWRDRPPLL